MRDLLRSTVGDDVATLLDHRTEPLTVHVHVDELLHDLGYWRLFDEATDELDRRHQAIAEPTIPVDDDPAHTAEWNRYEKALDQVAALWERLASPSRQLRPSPWCLIFAS